MTTDAIHRRITELDELPPHLSGLISDLVGQIAWGHYHWVEDGGLHRNELGPLDNLIAELELAATIARTLKNELETDD